jgi:voltage-gated potassium channel
LLKGSRSLDEALGVSDQGPATPDLSARDRRLERVLEAVVVLAALATIPLIIVQERGTTGALVSAVDWVIWAIFTVEYVVMLTIAEDRRAYTRANWWSPLVIVLSFPLLPAILSMTRLVRLARLGRLARLIAIAGRALHGLRIAAGRRGLLYVAGVSTVLVFVGGGLLMFFEPKAERFRDGIWWAVVTITTVGYGDITPETGSGRLVATVLMLMGIGLVATLAASVAAYFVGKDEATDMRNLEERLDRIERLLETSVASEPTSLDRNDALVD